MKVNLFIETNKSTTPEYVFFETLLNRIKKEYDTLDYTIIPAGGKDNLKNVISLFKENTSGGGKNILLFDADNVGVDNGGYQARRKHLEDSKKSLGIEFDLFLMPNNKGDGEFEDLLELITRRDLHEKFFECFEKYELCISSEKDLNGNTKYQTPNRKGKLHTYITSVPMSKTKRDKTGNGNWFFENKEYWDLENDALKPLIDFLKNSLITK